MFQRIAASVLVFAFAMFIGGCSGADKPGWLSFNPNEWSDRSIADDPILLDVSGPVQVNVQSFNGDVEIVGNPELTQAQVTFVREAVHGHGRIDEAKESLAQINTGAQVVAGDLGQALEVWATTNSAEPHFQRAHVYIELPDVDGVNVHTTNGGVMLKNVRGALDISTTEKDVRVATNQAMLRPVTIVNRDGDIDYRIRGESQGAFDAQTINGRVWSFAKYGTMSVRPPTRNDLLLATLNAGTNPVTLRTVNGNIRISVVHNPEKMQGPIID